MSTENSISNVNKIENIIINSFVNSNHSAKNIEQLIERIIGLQNFDKIEVSKIVNYFFEKEILTIKNIDNHGNTFYGLNRKVIKNFPDLNEKISKIDNLISNSYYGSGASIINGSRYTGD